MKSVLLSRREFLNATAGAAGASVIAGTALFDPQPSFAVEQSSSPSDQIRFGIVGVGMEGSGLLSTAIQLPGVKCVAAADLYDGRQELAKEIVGKPIRRS